MAFKEENYHIEKLKDGSNFQMWKFQVSVFFKAKQLFDIASGKTKSPQDATAKEDWEKKDAMAQKIIVTTVEKQPLTYLLNCKNSSEMFKKLKALYERDNQQQKCNLMQEFYNYKFEKGTNMSTYICDLENLAHKLRTLKQDITEMMLITKILSSLPDTYKYFISAWESTPTEKQTLTDLTSRLLAEENRHQIPENSSEQVAFNSAMDGRNKNKNKYNRGNFKSKNKNCFKCEQPGHFARDCRKVELRCNICKKTNHLESDCFFRKNKTYASGFNQPDKKMSFLTNHESTENSENNNIEWFLDSGATSHMTNEKQLIKNLTLNVTEIGTARKDVKMQALGTGNIETAECILKEVDLVPELSKNLLSVSKIVKSGAEIIFKNETVQVYKNKNKILEGKLCKNGLYLVNLTKIEETALINENVNASIWHKKLGHLSTKNMLKLKSISDGFNLTDAEIKDFAKLTCEVCIKAKQTRKPFEQNRQKATRPLEIIHTDICGPIEPSTWDGKKYFITFLDDYTHFCMVYLLNGKYEAVDAIKDYIKEAEVKWNLKTSKIRCDNGKEYANKYLKNWCRQRGITIDFTIPYTPQLNGKAERLNRTLLDKARALIFESSVNKNMWGEAIRVAAYLTNRMPTEALKITPFEMWNNKKPNLKYLQVFGTDAYAKKLEYIKKFDERTKKLTMIGYAQNGYRLFDNEKQRIIIARDVIFKNDETKLKLTNEVIIESENEEEPKSDEEEITCENVIPNEIEELGRGKRIKKVPAKYEDFALLTYEEAINGEDKDKWIKAIQEEKNSLEENNTWELINKNETDNKKILTNRWVFKIKEDGTYKARLVVRGCEQKLGIDYEETFSPVISSSAIRLIFAIAAENNYVIVKFDIKTAFLYGPLNDEVYMEIPQGYNIKNKVCKLLKGLYGLKQSPLNWNNRFTEFLKSAAGLQPIKSEKCLFKNADGTIIIAIYVDDGLIVGSDEIKINDFLAKLNDEFKVKISKNPSSYLGITIKRDNTGIILQQTEMTSQVLQKYKMLESNKTKIPLNSGDLKRSDIEPNKNFPYREAIGSLLYLSNKTRPDLSFAINYASRFMEQPTRSDVNNIKHIMKYLNGNQNLGIKFYSDNNDELKAYSDADYAGDIQTRKSTTGYIIFYNGGPISWCSRKQPIVALSTSEAEYIAAADCCKDLIYIKNLIEELKCKSVSAVLKIDNKSAIDLAKNGTMNKRSKHIDVRYHYIHEQVTSGIVKIEYCNTTEQIADIFTKPLDSTKFEKFRDKFMFKL